MNFLWLCMILVTVCQGAQSTEAESRRTEIRNGFVFAWSNYKRLAMGKDEVRPVSGAAADVTFGGWGVTLIDALDTLWLMDLKDEFNEAINVISAKDFSRGVGINSFFEVTIRILGGLISAYDLSGNPVLLDKARDIGEALSLDFNPNSGLPYTSFDFEKLKPWKSSYASLANVGSFQLEFVRLGQLTGIPKYEFLAYSALYTLDHAKPGPGLYYNDVNVFTGEFTSTFLTYGGGADSFYESLIKLYLMLGPISGVPYLRMFNESMTQFKSLVRPCAKTHVCLGSLDKDVYVERTEHLEFFVSGMLLLADKHLPSQNLALVALDLLKTFTAISGLSHTGLAPEGAIFNSSTISIADYRNLLRPELVESLFYAYRHTHDQKYRDQAWKIFQAFQLYSKAKHGYAEYSNVDSFFLESQQMDVMQSFFMGETLKYLYLIFSPDETLDLSTWVFNTEAHPFKMKNHFTK